MCDCVCVCVCVSDCVCDCVCVCVCVIVRVSDCVCFVVTVYAGIELLWTSVLEYYDRNKGHFHWYMEFVFYTQYRKGFDI